MSDERRVLAGIYTIESLIPGIRPTVNGLQKHLGSTDPRRRTSSWYECSSYGKFYVPSEEIPIPRMLQEMKHEFFVCRLRSS